MKLKVKLVTYARHKVKQDAAHAKPTVKQEAKPAVTHAKPTVKPALKQVVVPAKRKVKQVVVRVRLPVAKQAAKLPDAKLFVKVPMKLVVKALVKHLVKQVVKRLAKRDAKQGKNFPASARPTVARPPLTFTALISMALQSAPRAHFPATCRGHMWDGAVTGSLSALRVTQIASMWLAIFLVADTELPVTGGLI